MKNIKAFLAALLLFLISAAGIHLFVNDHLPSYSLTYGTWIDHSKYGCHEALEELLSSKESLPVFGSSELRHGQKSGFHADTIFKNADIEPVFIGEAGYQCLNQSIALGSLGKELSGRKVVLIVSPQWFKKTGVLANAFGNSFSEDNFIAFLQNTTISEKTRDYVIERAEKLTKGNRILYHKICNDVSWYTGKKLSISDTLVKDVHTYMVHDKAETGLMTRMLLKGVHGGPEKSANSSLSEETWDGLYQKAEQKGQKLANGNDLGMYDGVYNRVYRKMLEEGKFKNPGYTSDSIELQDLACFLEICREDDIQPLIIMMPFNGYWYDAIGFESSQRTEVYQAVSEMVKKYHAEYSDLSSQEYDQYYFEDNSHPALKGLVDLNETIYDFYSRNET